MTFGCLSTEDFFAPDSAAISRTIRPLTFPFLRRSKMSLIEPNRLLLDGRLHLAFGGKLQCFLEILACAHNRSPHGLAIQHQIENGNWEFAGRQTVQNAGPATAQRARVPV